MTVFNIRRTSGQAVLALSLIAVATPAYPQAWIGQVVGNMIAQQQAWAAEQACMTGTAMPDVEVTEARPSTLTSMRGYWDAVKAGGPSSVTSQFHVSKKSAWINGATKVAIVAGAKVTDPFALPGAQLAAEPLRYFRSGDGASVRTQWEVRGGSGELIGTYDVELRRGGSTWRPFEMKLVPANQYVEPLVQYCHAVGDVMPFRLRSTEGAMTYTAKRAVKMAAKADKAEAEANKALAKTMNASGAASPADKLKAGETVSKAKAARAKADEAKLAAENAAAAHALAKADSKALEDARAVAMAKLASKS
jgi:hypothetical protein